MPNLSRINFKSEQIPNQAAEDQKVEKKKEVIYVSKTPEAAVNAAGVIAGTSGMIGGAILGGAVGVSRLPGEYIKQFASQDYTKLVKDGGKSFKEALLSSPEIANLTKAINEIKSPEAAEEVIEIAKTLSERLHNKFAGDKEAIAVIDKVIDPLVNSVSMKKNIRSYGSGLRMYIKSPVGQTILKFLGFNKKTSSIVRDVTGNMAEGITKAVENIKNFTPEERQAWNKVSKEIYNELQKNNKIKFTTSLATAIKRMTKSTDWIVNPLKKLQETLKDGASNLNKSLGKAPLKTVGIYSAIGAVSVGAISLLGWFGMKKSLMKKEEQNNNMTQN